MEHPENPMAARRSWPPLVENGYYAPLRRELPEDAPVPVVFHWLSSPPEQAPRARATRLLVVVRIARVRGVGHEVLEHLAHRHVEIDALRRDLVQEPLRVDRVDLARL